MLRRNGGHPGHVFNLGHGVLPETDPDVLERVVELVHAEGRATADRALTRRRRRRGRDGLRHARRRPTTSSAYYTHIRRGRPPDARAAGRPRRAATTPSAASRRWPSAPRRSAPASPAALDERAPGRCRGRARARSTPRPFIEDAVADAGRRRASTDVVGLVLAPHYSAVSVGEYQRRAAEAAAGRGVRRDRRSTAGTCEPAYLDFLAARRRRRPGRRCPSATQGALHRPLASPSGCWSDDPYPDQLRASAAAVAEPGRAAPVGRVGASPGRAPARTPEPWRGPDILEVIRDLAATGRADGRAASARRASSSDHLEVLYDLDIEARGRGRRGRAWPSPAPASLNDDPAVMARARRPGRRLAAAPAT